MFGFTQFHVGNFWLWRTWNVIKCDTCLCGVNTCVTVWSSEHQSIIMTYTATLKHETIISTALLNVPKLSRIDKDQLVKSLPNGFQCVCVHR